FVGSTTDSSVMVNAGSAAGSYDLQLTMSWGGLSQSCDVVASVNVVSLTKSSRDVSCNGGSDGAIDLSVSGGTAPYSYAWSNGATTQDLSGLAAGNYSVTVTDLKGCQGSTSVSNAQPAVLALSESHTAPACNGGSDGSIDFSVSGGTPPYGYGWSNGAATQDLSGLTAGSYSVTVTDAKGCQASASISLVSPAALALSESHADPACNGGSDGSINLSVNGGTPPYGYA